MDASNICKLRQILVITMPTTDSYMWKFLKQCFQNDVLPPLGVGYLQCTVSQALPLLFFSRHSPQPLIFFFFLKALSLFKDALLETVDSKLVPLYELYKCGSGQYGSKWIWVWSVSRRQSLSMLYFAIFILISVLDPDLKGGCQGSTVAWCHHAWSRGWTGEKGLFYVRKSNFP